jgi:hypothetical protein
VAAALDRVRAGALEAATGGAGGAPTSPPPTPLVDRLGRRRAHRARWVVQVAGLAAAALVAVGAAALLRSPGDDRPTSGETAAAEVDRAGREGAGEETLSAQRAEGDASASAPAAAAPGSSRGDGSGLASTSTPSLGVHATVGDLLATLDQRVGDASARPAAPSAASGDGPGTTTPSTAAAPATTAPFAAASGSPSCPTQGGDLLGTALVGGRALLVLETTGPSGERRLVGIDAVGCTPVFDEPG